MINHDPIADLDLESVTRDDFLEWRDRLIDGRQARTVNRHVRGVAAALNRAIELGHIGNPARLETAFSVRRCRGQRRNGGLSR